ncbi:MAG: 50S ribosomal protein L25 [Planctomycetes bacterium]|nr:50S ribosomal protein L25 [Planctomycetota bacterium]
MELYTLKATPRTKVGTPEARRLRAKKQIPAVLYGHKQDTVSVTIVAEDFAPIVKKGLRLVELELPGKKEHVYVKSVQRQAITDQILSVDFNRIDLNEKISVKVPLRLRGHSVGVAKGGVLDTQLVEIPVQCLPLAIPALIDVDITNLEMGGLLHLRDVKLPEGVVLDANPDMIVAGVHEPIEEVPTVAVVEAGPAEPEVITRKKEDEEAPKPEEKGKKKE